MRVAREEEARRVSAAIDEEIRQERAMAKKRKVVKLLLLGQSESGWLFFLLCFFKITFWGVWGWLVWLFGGLVDRRMDGWTDNCVGYRESDIHDSV